MESQKKQNLIKEEEEEMEVGQSLWRVSRPDGTSKQGNIRMFTKGIIYKIVGRK